MLRLWPRAHLGLLHADPESGASHRAAVQASYFSWRIGTQDRTGITDDQEIWTGLRDAEQMLRSSGARIISEGRMDESQRCRSMGLQERAPESNSPGGGRCDVLQGCTAFCCVRS